MVRNYNILTIKCEKFLEVFHLVFIMVFTSMLQNNIYPPLSTYSHSIGQNPKYLFWLLQQIIKYPIIKLYQVSYSKFNIPFVKLYNSLWSPNSNFLMFNIAFKTRQIDPHIGIMVKTPQPIKMVILGPKNYRFGLRDPHFV
jgi:hypothetical protein